MVTPWSGSFFSGLTASDLLSLFPFLETAEDPVSSTVMLGTASLLACGVSSTSAAERVKPEIRVGVKERGEEWGAGYMYIITLIVKLLWYLNNSQNHMDCVDEVCLYHVREYPE